MNYNSQGGLKQALSFRIVETTSEEVDYPSSELLDMSTNSKGWQTKRYVNFPQHIIVQFFNPVKLQALQLLSHQCKIASKVEIFAHYNPNSFDQGGMGLMNLHFRKLGYFLLSPNEQSGFQARELKTVYLNAPCQFLKVVFHHPHANSYNIFNQVGVIGLTLTGDQMVNELNSLQGNSSFINTMAKPQPPLSMQMQYDPKTLAELEQLERAKINAISKEDYVAAKKIKEKIDFIKKYSEQLLKLEQRKEIAIKNEDYDAAIALKGEIEKLRTRMIASSNQQSTQQNPYRDPYQRHGGYDQGGADNYMSVPNPRSSYKPAERRRSFMEPAEDRRNQYDRDYGYEDENQYGRTSYRPNTSRRGYDDEMRDDRRGYNDRMEDDNQNFNRQLNFDDKMDNSRRDFDDRNDYNQGYNDSMDKQDEFEKKEREQLDMKGRRNPGRNRRRNPRSNRQKAEPSPDNHEEEHVEEEKMENMIVKKPDYGGVNPFDEQPAFAQKNNQQELDEFPNQDQEDERIKEKPNVSKKNKIVMDGFSLSFDNEFLEYSFSSNIKHREQSVNKFLSVLSAISKKRASPPTEMIIESQLEDAMVACWKLCNWFFEDRPPKIIEVCFKIYELILVISDKNNVPLGSITEFIKSNNDTILTIMDKVSSFTNTEQIKKIVRLILSTIGKKTITMSDFVNNFVKTKGVPKKLTSFKHLTGRCIVLQKLVNKLPEDTKDNSDTLLEFCVENMKSSNNGVREQTMKLIVLISNLIGDKKVIGILTAKKVRKNQIEQIKELIEDGVEFEESDLEKIEEEYSEEEPIKKQPSVKKKPRKRSRTPARQPKSEEEPINESQLEDEPMFDISDTCTFCMIKNENFREKSQYDMHLFKECPVLTLCKHCDQVIGCDSYTTHLIEECARREKFVKCPRCKLAIIRKRAQEHIEIQQCPLIKEGKGELICPLCRNGLKVKDESEASTWVRHFVHDGCPKQVRTF